jgi:hypothetical protein
MNNTGKLTARKASSVRYGSPTFKEDYDKIYEAENVRLKENVHIMMTRSF